MPTAAPTGDSPLVVLLTDGRANVVNAAARSASWRKSGSMGADHAPLRVWRAATARARDRIDIAGGYR